MNFENCDDYKTLLTDNRISDRYIKCNHCGYHNLGDLVDAVDTLNNDKIFYLPKPKHQKSIVQKLFNIFKCC